MEKINHESRIKMNGNNPLHKKIKDKIEQHEFNFDQNAWAEMEMMLEEKSSPVAENTETKSFTTVKIIGIMMTLLLLIWIISNQFLDNFETSNANENAKIEIAENLKIQSEPSFRPEYSGLKPPEGNPLRTLEGTGGTKSENARNQNVTNVTNLTNSTNVAKAVPFALRVVNPVDTGKINNALNNYTAHYQNEKVFIHLDKTIYKPTEAVWFTVFVRNGNRLTASLSELVYVELIAPNGKTLKTLTLLAADGMAAGDFQLTDDFVGGLYKIKAYTKWQQNTGDAFEKTLQVQKTVLPKLNMKLEFTRKTYGAGDEVVADLILETVTNQALANQDFDFTVSLAGQQILSEKAKTNGKGKTEIKFSLPKNLKTNDGLLNVMIPYNGSTESIARSVPIVLNKIDVQFLPEGGDLVADLKSNVAFKAVNEFGQPADIEGEIYNSKGEKVTTFASYYQGMGGFDLLAKADEKYRAKIMKPVGITKLYDLPLAKAETAILNIIKQTKEKITVRIASSVKANYVLTVTAREKIILTEILNDLDGEKTVEINTKDLPIGITQLTLFASPENSGNGTNQAIAERLVFINPYQQLHIEIETDKENYKLRETVKAKIKVTDENGNAVKGQFSVSVVDETLLSHADDKQANLLAYFLLTSDLKGEIKEPNFYFEKEEKTDKINKEKALDYVLLTHGWRRFAWEQVLAGNFPRFGYPHETTKFQGQVMDAFNRPLANANVEVKGRKNQDITTVTDAHGRFLLDKVGLLPPFTIKATYEEFDAKKEINSYAQNCQIKVMANYSRDIYGRVVDYRSRSVEGAKIEIVGNDVATLAAVSDKSGSFMIPKVDFHKYNQVQMAYEGIKRNQPLYQYVNGNTVLFNTETNKISDLTGQVVNQKGENLEGAAVTIDGMADTVFTDKKGRFFLPNVDFSRFTYVKGIYDGRIQQAYIRGVNESIIRFANVNNIKIKYADKTSLNPIIRGFIEDGTGEPAIFATVKVIQNGNVIGGMQTDFDGNYELKNLQKGMYDLEVNYVGYDAVFVRGVIVNDKNITVDFPMYQTVNLNEVVITHQVPLVRRDNTTQSVSLSAVKIQRIPVANNNNVATYTQTVPNNLEQGTIVTSADIQKLAPKNINGIIAQTAGISSADNDGIINIRGSRSPATAYYIDGIRVSSDMIPQSQIEQVQVITGGTPASIGNFSGDIINNLDNEVNFYTNQDGEVKEGNRRKIFIEEEANYPGRPGNYSVGKAVRDYGYAATFQNGYYKARTFYTPKYKSSKTDIRDDFRTTLYWENALETNEKGEAEFEFPNADATTNYRITVAGFSDDGQIGLNTEKYFVQMPFALQTKVPNSILTGDKLTIPVTLMNNTNQAIEGELLIELPTHFELLNDVDKIIKLAAKTTKVVQLEFLIGNEISQGNVNIRFQADDFEDAFTTNIQTISRGFPVHEIIGDNKISRDFDFNLREPLDGTLEIKLTVHPNVLSDLVTGVDRMFRQPSGCFEQVSSSNYPNLLALNYMRNANIRNQQIEGKAERFLAIGYDKMKSYEVEGGGFDWWGKAPAHEGLTAYGLMQLVDMSKVFEVEQDLIDRTANWLLSRKDGKGNWEVNGRYLHKWNADDKLVYNSYIIWGLTEAGYGDKIQTEIDFNYDLAIKSENPYAMALMANALSIMDDERADDLIKALLLMQKEDGSWTGTQPSVVGSQGKSLQIETTALVALAIMDWEANEDLALQKAMDFMATSKNEYGFGSTQSTVLAMKALVEYAEYSKNMGEDGKVILYKGDREIAVFDYTKDMNQPIIFENLQAHFFDKKNKLKVRFVGTEKALPYDLSVNYHTALPQGSPTAPIFIETKIENPKAKVGETVRLSVTLQNNRYETLQNPIAIVGIPSGLTLQPWQLRKFQEENVADYVELWNGYIVFYFREMTEQKVINLDLKAETAGTFEAPASSAYLYYDNEEKSWSLPKTVIVE